MEGQQEPAPRIAVVGSLNADVTLWVPRRPSPDETMHAERIAWFRGGKGANQAVAAARLGAEVAMVGRVGNDEHGRWLRSGLAAEGIDCTQVTAVEAATGLAVITVDPHDVSIVVAAGANALLDANDVRAAGAAIAGADALLLQGEVSAGAAAAAAEIAREHSVLVVANPAPYNDVAAAAVPLADVVIVNRDEARRLRDDMAAGTAPALRPDAVLVETRGAQGCVVVAPRAAGSARRSAPDGPVDASASGYATSLVSGGTARGDVVVAAPRVEVVDATGAGDAFAGAFAVAMASGATVEEAARLAVRAGAWAVTVAGAQPSLPTMDQLRRLEDHAVSAVSTAPASG
ncbi:PfkB family carbohydrate kinase [Candidatus Poriferisodalis sp.]|uniref:PfkB family carbohydrate kinase n=1 Tax=Candidatus Poriferisodalis sp. TaxID=3101277 RepID=UPI003B015056